jgi:hypothetical protein
MDSEVVKDLTKHWPNSTLDQTGSSEASLESDKVCAHQSPCFLIMNNHLVVLQILKISPLRTHSSRGIGQYHVHVDNLLGLLVTQGIMISIQRSWERFHI